MVYVTGDLHGETARLSRWALRRLRKGDTLLICGDFGCIWAGDKKESRFLKKLGRRPYHICFVDGRHENYSLLAQYPVEEFAGGQAQRISGNLFHLLRGEIYTIEGKTYFTCGGGESDDFDMRDETGTWWAEEMPSEQELIHGLENLDAHGHAVDYIITHEPSGKSSGYLSPRRRPGGLQVYFDRLEETVTFEKWFFGCLHIDKRVTKRHRAVYRAVCPVQE